MHISNRNGSLLIEVLLTVIILSVSLTLIIRAMVVSRRAAVLSRDYSRAVFLLDDKMFDYMHQQSLEEEGAYPSGQPFSSPFERFRYDFKTQPLDDRDISEVNFKISWKSGKNEKNIPVTTYLFTELRKSNP